MRIIKYFLILLHLIVQNNLFAQVSDSLQKVLKTNIHDSVKCEVYMQLIEEEENLEVWSKYNDELLKISNANLPKHKKGSKAYKIFLKYYAAYFNNNGWICNHKGDVTKALEHYHKSLKIYEELNQKDEVATLYGNIAHIWNSQGEFEKSIEYYQHSLYLNIEAKNKKGEAFAYNNIAATYRKKGDYKKAVEYCYKSLEMMEELKDKKGTATLYTNIGTLLGKTKQEEKGLEFLQKGLAIKEEVKDDEGASLSLSLIGNLYFKLGKTQQALEYGLKSLELTKKLGYPDHIRRAADLLKSVYTKKGDYKKAMEMFELYVLMKDSINNEATRKASIKNQLQYEYDKKAATDSIKASEEKKLSQAKLAESQAKLKQEKTQRIALYSGLFLVVIFSIFIFNRFRVTQKQNGIIQQQKILVEEQKHIVEEKQKEILDSINYAKRLQEAILPPISLIQEHVKESFILYKPKDIVAGDFYWAEHVDDIFFIAAADSTGHGVPGAMISVVCSNALNRAVLEFGQREPGKILDKTRELVLTTFAKSDKEVKDGMDISLCTFDKKNKIIAWSGANNPLWILSSENDTPTIQEIKANKQAIGKTDNPLPFTSHVLNVKEGDQLFLFTDGYADQFGGPKGKKFKYKQLQDLLTSISSLNMQQQQLEIDNQFISWLGDHEQVDDVTIIGIKI